MSERRLAVLLKEIVEKCNALPKKRPAIDDPALTMLLAQVIGLIYLVTETGVLCIRHRLDTRRFGRLRDLLEELLADTIMPIMARGESPEGIVALQERYSWFNPEISPEQDEFRWIQLMGTVYGIREYAKSLLKAVNGPTNEAAAPGPQAFSPSGLDRTSPKGSDLQTDENRPLIVKEVANLLRASEGTVHDWIRTGQLKASNLSKADRPRYVIRRQDIGRFLESRQFDPKPRDPKRKKPKESTDRY